MKNKYDIKNVKWVSIKKIKPWKENPRKNDKAAEKLAPIIAEHGFKSPLVVWDKDNTIYKGNTSFKAAKLNKMKMVPVAFVSFPSANAAKAYAIADNKAGEFSEWDEDVLFKLMSSKEMKSPEKTGFQQKEINDLLMLADDKKMEDMEESDVGILSTIRIVCKPTMKEKITNYLERNLLRKYPEDVVIK